MGIFFLEKKNLSQRAAKYTTDKDKMFKKI